MILSDAAIFFGRFHPLLVHLPIGFLLLAVVLAVLGRREKYQSIQPAVSFSLLAGTICAIVACATGYILSFNGDYNEDVLTIHMWGGLCTATVSAIAYLVSIKKISLKFLQTSKALLVTLFIMVALISFTGHFGGTLTHGPGYISSDLLFAKLAIKKQITDINEAVIYDDLVQPILEKKCSNCHNSNKKKGELSMESYLTLLKGGKNGVIVEAGHAEKSEMIKRVNLDPKDEKYMPADGKPPLSEEEKSILTWWIEKGGASITKKVKEAGATAPIKKDINNYLGLQKSDPSEEEALDSSSIYFAQLKVPKVSEQQVNTLKQEGYIIKFINLKPLLLDVTLPENLNESSNSVADKLNKLLALKENIIWLNVSGNNISDTHLVQISQFKNLQRLRLDKNPISDIGISKLQSLANLESINLYNTKVTRQSISILSPLLKLKHMYVWGTGIKKEDIAVSRDSTKIIMGVN
ncbi:MAG: c-type cytochrome domain-containing protein [Chitinophagaceae bacterium]